MRIIQLWATLAVVVLLLSACGEVVQFPGNGGGDDGVLHQVTYRVVGTEGVISAEVEYQHGNRRRKEPVQLPWTKTVTVDDLDEASLVARGVRNQLGQITCAIFEGDKLDERKLFSSVSSRRGVNPVASCT